MKSIYLLYILGLFFSIPSVSADLDRQVAPEVRFDLQLDPGAQSDLQEYFPDLSFEQHAEIYQDQRAFERYKEEIFPHDATPEQLKEVLFQDYNNTLLHLIKKNVLRIADNVPRIADDNEQFDAEQFAQEQFDAIQEIKQSLASKLKTSFLEEACSKKPRNQMPKYILDTIEKTMRSLDINPRNIHINYFTDLRNQSPASMKVIGKCRSDKCYIIREFDVSLISLSINSSFAFYFKDTEYFKSIILHELAHLLELHDLISVMTGCYSKSNRDTLALKRHQEFIADIFPLTLNKKTTHMVYRSYSNETNYSAPFTGKYISSSTRKNIAKKFFSAYYPGKLEQAYARLLFWGSNRRLWRLVGASLMGCLMGYVIGIASLPTSSK